MKKHLLPLLLVWSLFIILTTRAIGYASYTPASRGTPTPGAADESTLDDQAAIKEAIHQAVIRNQEKTLAFLIFDVQVESIQFSQFKDWAIVWLNFVDPQSKQIIPTEPGIAIAHFENAVWHISLQTDQEWNQILEILPAELMTLEIKTGFHQVQGLDQQDVQVTYGGYLLPWPGGQTMYLTQSIAHGSGSMYYAFDFADGSSYPSPMFPVSAARSGIVKYMVWNYPNGYWDGNPNHANYIVLEDRTTSPTTYMVYLHLAYNSIPEKFRNIGAQVTRGEKLGLADDTGYSTGNHLHFQVHTNTSSWWGTSIDITFDDVLINGGRPRLPSEAKSTGEVGQNAYVSGNTPPAETIPPVGEISIPVSGSTISDQKVKLAALVSDAQSGVKTAYFLGKFLGEWIKISPDFTTASFSYDWDLCGSQVPDGPVSVALFIQDREGNQALNLPGLTHFTKNYTCSPPPPACTPNDDQVALFTDIHYSGNCKVLGVGEYGSVNLLAPVVNNSASSILVGKNAVAHVYHLENFSGRHEILTGKDSNLADNIIGDDRISSIKVQTSLSPDSVIPTNEPADPSRDEVIFWRNTSPVSLPFLDNMEGGPGIWTASGLWHLIDSASLAHSSSHSWWYGQDGAGSYETGSRTSGGLVSAPILVSETGYHLSFWYRYNTENDGTHWDQRLIQISVEGGEYQTLLQLSEDYPNWWLQSPDIDLSTYAGKVIQIRFLFDTIDAYFNNFQGWFVDDVQITNETLPVCSDGNEPNNSPAQAKRLNFGDLIQAEICPRGDIDMYTFSGNEGDRIVIDVDAKTLGSDMDAIVFLLDEDGSSLLAEHDDEVIYEKQDPHLGYVLPRTGKYYFKLRAWDHPSTGGSSSFYSLSLFTDSDDPGIKGFVPTMKNPIVSNSLNISLHAEDPLSGISFVEFQWHSGDWIGGTWETLAIDRDGQDGWKTVFDLTNVPDQTGMAVYARVHDWAGNWIGVGSWDLILDRVAPSTNVKPLTPIQESTAVLLQFSAQDQTSGVAKLSLEVNKDNSGWSFFADYPGDVVKTWFFGEQGSLYAFRLQGVDNAGNVEPLPASEDTVTLLQRCTSPDSWEADDTPEQAKSIHTNGEIQAHNLCKIQDVDWLKMVVQKDVFYPFEVYELGSTTDIDFGIFTLDGKTLLFQPDPSLSGFGKLQVFEWLSDRDGPVGIRIRHKDPRVAGNKVTYKIFLSEEHRLYFPLSYSKQ